MICVCCEEHIYTDEYDVDEDGNIVCLNCVGLEYLKPQKPTYSRLDDEYEPEDY